jgi:sulfur relay (sulfurtransferase) complex TusBCD TusD component (DsrE family)
MATYTVKEFGDIRIETNHNLTYIIDKKAKKVKAVLTRTSDDTLHTVRKVLDGVKNGNISVDPNSLKMNNSYTGVAVCAEQDEFDIEVGKDIARRRAIVKYNAARNARLENLIRELSTVSTQLTDEVDYSNSKIERIEAELKEYE